MVKKTNKEISNVKDIDLSQEIYIHYHKQNFLDYQKKYAPIDINWDLVSMIYKQDAATLRNKMGIINNITNKDGQSVIDALGLINDLNDLSDIEKDVSDALPDLIRKGISDTKTFSADLRDSADINNSIVILDNYINYMKKVISAFEKTNDDYMNYILNKYNNNSKVMKNINNLFLTASGLNLLAINKTALTSFESLKSKLENFKNFNNSLKTSIQKKKNLKYRNKILSYSSLISSMSQLFVNILGGIGEGYGALLAIQTLNDYIKTLESKEISVEVEGTGTEKSISGSTKKADYTININSENNTINLSFGISAKAQSLQKGKNVTTIFETTTLKKIFEKYITINNIEKYVFYNNLYHNINNQEMQYLRRKYAAISLLSAISGINQGENVLFLQYLDELIRLDEFFESLAEMSSQNLPTINVAGTKSIRNSNDFITRRGEKLNTLLKTENYKDLDPDSKNLIAWVRSRQVLNKMNNLSTQIQFKH